jgi:hypothetical protein
MTYAIEKNVPMPTSSGQNFAPVYRWDDMKEVGDSFFVGEETAPEGDTNLTKLRSRIYNAARAYGKPRNIEFKALVVEEERPNPEFRERSSDPVPEGQEPEPQFIKVRGVRCWLMELPPVAEPVRTDENDQSRDPQV